MYCIQCEQTIKKPGNFGCQYSHGACGKEADVADLQDVLIATLQGVSFWVDCCRHYNIIRQDIDIWSFTAFFSTLTNVNFSAERIAAYIQQAEQYKEELKQLAEQAIAKTNDILPALSRAAALPSWSVNQSAEILPRVAVNYGADSLHEDVISLRLLCLYGLKGAAAYLQHAAVLNEWDQQVCAEYHSLMTLLGSDLTDVELLLNTAMRIGQLNYQAIELLNSGETKTFGHPRPTEVNINPVQGHCILVSGHDLKDLHALLEQTKDTGIKVYTHGEMLPAHGYPGLNKYTHLVGNYGGAWYQQQTEFADFPGPIVMTSNCIIDPNVGGYADRIYTCNMVGWPGVKHIAGNDFSQVIQHSLELPGFTQTQTVPAEFITVGFAHNTLQEVLPTVIEQVKAGNIRRFFVVGGCDGDRQERNYYTDLVQSLPDDCVVLTLGCNKYRFNKQQFGEINGIPRLIDIGQCNDTYSAIQLALWLAKEFNCDINELPLTLSLSWFEQKAIAILLTLLSLNVKGIYTGPTLPAFLTDNVLHILQERFDLRGVTSAKQDLQEIFDLS